VILDIVWNVSPELIEGWKTPNKYGLLFVSGLIIGYFVIQRMFKKEGVPEKELDKLLIYMVLATVIGARLGHVFFYDWADYKNDLWSIFKIWEGGLASHGAAIAILLSLWFYSIKVSKKPMLWILDRVSAPIVIASCFIRLGNLMNSEIVGKETTSRFGFKFVREYFPDTKQLTEYLNIPNPNDAYAAIVSDPKYADMLAAVPVKHPAQLYEAISYLALFILLFWMYWKTNAKEKSGLIFGIFMIGVWGMRFLIEYIKEGQTARDFEYAINTGQMLSIPLFLVGVFLVIRAVRGEKSLKNG